jgi:hypothetical protein
VVVLGLLISLCACNVLAKQQEHSIAKTSGPPSFFIRDPTDGLCLSGTVFKRCGIDTLWFVEGKAGVYQIHRRPRDETDLEECLDKQHCHLDDSPARLSNCNHCGTKKWNILGDDDDGIYSIVHI